MRILKILLAVLLVTLVSYLVYANIPFFAPTSRTNQGRILLTAHWKGDGDFARYTPAPEEHTLGCWSTTFSQIFYFHKLQPYGSVHYRCSRGYEIDENLSDHKFNFAIFTDKMSDSTSETAISEIARYCYSVAAVVQKDFGTGRYITKLPPADSIESHFTVRVNRYLVYRGLFQSRRKIRNIVIREIESNRPLYLYYRNMHIKGSGHSVVLDGYRFDNGDFVVHLNFGWG